MSVRVIPRNPVLAGLSFLNSWLGFKSRHTLQQPALLRRIVDRIRNSLELKVVLQTAVDEVAAFLGVDHCLFFWHFNDLQRVQVVCEHTTVAQCSLVGHYALSEIGSVAAFLAQGDLAVTIGQMPSPEGASFLADWVVGDPIVVGKASSSPAPMLLDRPISLLVPVRGQDNTLGFIACLSESPRRWQPVELEVMQAIAQQLEIAIRQAQLYERTQKQAQRERLVNQITTQTRQSLDLKEILKQAIAHLLDALEVDRCLVHLVEDPDDDEEQTVDSLSTDHDRVVFRRKHLFEVCRHPFEPSIDDFDTNGPITAWVIQHRQQVVISDVTQDARIGPHNAEYQLAQIKSSLAVPVQANGSLQAILYLNQCSHVRYWSRDDQKLAQAVADQLAISIQQGHLYAQTRQQAHESAAQAKRLAEALHNLQQTQVQLIQSEKMSGLGQMVAGVAHEINNPISFIYGNVPYVERYVQDLLRLLQAYQAVHVPNAAELQRLADEIELEFLMQDLPRILQSMRSGAGRIREIVTSLRSFSHLDEAHCKATNLHDGLTSTLAVLKSQIPADVEIICQFGTVPLVQCFPALMNQVYFNLLINALEAIAKSTRQPKTIRITTESFVHDQTQQRWVRIIIADSGCGIPDDVQTKIFDPFFTTKDIGQGCGLGLTVSYQTVVHQHHGHLTVHSVPMQGTEFVIEIPVEHSALRVQRRNRYLQTEDASNVSDLEEAVV